ncbi:MAG TPA: replication factor C small subunit, partial [Candidatus Aenigmarchaeota archaeon]|nr:replication factor C small subunit [Candidatus Aenigmarchaeota archaeon]
MEIWTEKYRPKTLDEVVGQEKVVEKLKAFVRAKNLPHLLFAGPAGTGKTTCALAIARELYGEEWRDNLLELNASDERGIDTIRTKVKEFARTKPIGDFPFKIILLDEADALTRDAQQALRRTMENFSSTCRFILDCNFSSKIIEPIQSRCAIFRFKPLEKEAIQKYIM